MPTSLVQRHHRIIYRFFLNVVCAFDIPLRLHIIEVCPDPKNAAFDLLLLGQEALTILLYGLGVHASSLLHAGVRLLSRTTSSTLAPPPEEAKQQAYPSRYQ